ncbi:MAG: hemerythrin domain-containing protein [Novosphingobium sp.]
MTEARIYEALKEDHNHHRRLLQQIGATDDRSERTSLFETLRKELQAHAAAEEESLYATMLGNPDLRDEARHSVSEHKEIDDFLGELVEADEGSDTWTETFEKMRHRYLHHIDEEEADMFPEAAEKLSDAEEERLSETFEQRKPEELARAAEELPGDARE